MWEKALQEVSWALPAKSDIMVAAMALLGDAALTTMKREAVINAARQEGDAHLPRLQKAFPGIDLMALVQALRVKFVEMRLEGRI